MRRWVVAAALVGLLLGGGAGFLWWGMPAGRRVEEARQRVDDLARQLEAAEARTRAVETELKGVGPRLEALQGDLAAERQRRARLELIISQGRK